MLPLLIMTTDMAMLNSCGNEGCRSPRVKTKLKRGFPSSLGLGDHLVDQLELRADVEERARDLTRSTVIGKGITKARMAKETHEGPLLLIKARQR